MNIESIAKICHEANRAYCENIGDYSQKSWEQSPNWQTKSAINGVKFALENNTTPEELHANWVKDKANDGWVFGEVKDPDKKTHPCFLPYSQLPNEQKIKDKIFQSIVNIFKV